MQKTIVLEHNGNQVVSQPFKFIHACLIDDERYKGGGLATGARNALVKMFEGTVITEEIIEEEIEIKVLRNANDKIINMFLGIDEEVKTHQAHNRKRNKRQWAIKRSIQELHEDADYAIRSGQAGP